MKKLLLASLAPLLTFASSPLDVTFSTDRNAENGKIIVSVTNHSKQNIEVLKWNTPFEKTLNADIFDVNMGKKDSVYTGRVIKRATAKDSDYLLLEAGDTKRITVAMPTYYAMKQKGDYTIHFDGTFKYRLLDSTELKSFKLAKKALPEITLSFTPSIHQKRATLLKQTAKFNSCSENQIKVLKIAHDDAIKISKESRDVLVNAPKKTSSERYTTWFGKADEARQTKVTEGFKKIYDAFENRDVSFDCSTCKEDKDMYDSTYAYVHPNSQYEIYLCGAFWQSSTTGTDTQAGTLVHEVSHFTVVANTTDHVYGQELSQKLAKESPEKAVNNAENYDYFAENNPKLNMDSRDGNNDNSDNNDGSDNGSDDDWGQEEKELNLCFELTDDAKMDACFTAWEDKYYPYDEGSDDNWDDDELDWDDIDWDDEK